MLRNSGILCESSNKTCHKSIDISVNEYRLITGIHGINTSVQCLQCPLSPDEQILTENERYRVVKNSKEKR